VAVVADLDLVLLLVLPPLAGAVARRQHPEPVLVPVLPEPGLERGVAGGTVERPLHPRQAEPLLRPGLVRPLPVEQQELAVGVLRAVAEDAAGEPAAAAVLPDAEADRGVDEFAGADQGRRVVVGPLGDGRPVRGHLPAAVARRPLLLPGP